MDKLSCNRDDLPVMLIHVLHSNNYRYDPPAKSVIQILHLTPRNHDGQFVNEWRIELSADCRLAQHQDAFGNCTHAFTADGPLAELTVQVEAHGTLAASEWQVLEDELGRRLRAVIEVRPRIAIVPPGTIPRPEFKASRVRDQRREL